MKEIIIVFGLVFSINMAVASTELLATSGAFLNEEQNETRNGHPQTLFWYDNKRLRLPTITYQMLEKQDLMRPQWGVFTDASDQPWHLHWAMANRGDIEISFHPSHYNYEVILKDSSGIDNNSSIDSKFATYIVQPYSIYNSQYRAPPLYTFFLSLPACCRMHHY